MFNCPDLSGCKKFTMCFWAKIEDDANITTNWQDIIGFTTQTADNSTTGQLRSESYYGSVTATSNIRYIHWHDNGTYAFSDFTVYHTANGDTQRNVWHHCVLAMDSENGILAYTDGNPITVSGGTVMNGGHLTGQFWLGETNNIQGVINDVRVYKDEILSPKVIKELSKGLVCHYTLAAPGGTNIVKQSSIWRNGSCASGITSSVLSDGTYQVVASSGNNNWNTSWFSTLDGIEDSFAEGDEFTISFTIKSDNNTKLPTIYIKSGMGYYSMIGKVSSQWSTIYYTGTWKKANTLSPHLGWSGIVGTYQFKNWKLEKGNKPTPWIPHVNDPEYTKMGFDDGIEYDVSGYGYNGTKTGTITYDTDTPRYWTSTYFDGGDNAISVPFNTVISDSSIPFTINLWFKKTELGTDGYETLFGGPGGFEMDTRSGNSTTLSLYMASTRGGNVYSPFNLNEWYMVSLASDRTNEYYYVNGELVKTIEAKTMPIGNYFIGAWQIASKQNIKGCISDFRIYSTCLSEADILALYNTPISLSSNGTLLTQGEFTEV